MLTFEECWSAFEKLFPNDPKGKRPQQSYFELELFYPYVVKLRPRLLLEIGVEYGGTLIFWINAADPNAKILAIDWNTYMPSLIPIWESWLTEGQRLFVINRDSRDEETIEEVKHILGDDKLDFLFIDGNHTMPVPKLDYENYSPLVRPGGIIAFHDIAGPPLLNQPGLAKYWRDLKVQLVEHTYAKTVEFVCRHYTTGTSGIGMIMLQEENDK